MPTKPKSPRTKRRVGSDKSGKGRVSGLVLCVDPGSNLCGVVILNCDGSLLAAKALKGGSGGWGDRMINMIVDFYEWLETLNLKAAITELVFERIPRMAHPGLQGVVNVFLLHPLTQHLDIKVSNGVSPSSWKAWARRHGCTMPDPKGLKAVSQSVHVATAKLLDSEDVADALLIGLCWLESKR